MNIAGVDQTYSQTLFAWFSKRAAVSKSRQALSYQGETWSYGEMFNRVRKIADALYFGGARKGDRVGFLGFNSPDLLVVQLASASIGAIFVPLNFRLVAAELEYLIVDAGIHTLFVGEEHIESVQPFQSDLPCRHYIQLGQSVVDWQTFNQLLCLDIPSAPLEAVNNKDIATILYTSGTTGRPKGAMLTHENIWANNLNWIFAYGLTPQDVMLTVAPMFHAGGLFALLLSVLSIGGHVVLHKNFVADEVLQSIENYSVTMTFGVPTMILGLTQSPMLEKTDISSLRVFISGGAPAPEALLRTCDALAIPVSHAYGMTEGTSAVTFLEPELAIEKVNSCGRAMMLSEMRLVDDNGNEVSLPDVMGEVLVRGSNVFVGYWGLEEATAEALSESGWFSTGDVGYLDSDGFLYVCDRKKDMIISGGENIYPAEIESVLLEHPKVINAAVIAMTDETWGESVVAVVVLKPTVKLGLDELLEHCATRLARYKLPKKLQIVDELPLSGAGKVLKKELRETLANTREEGMV